MTHQLTDTVALVTGASSGIGRATACSLAGAGATVAVLARRSERLTDLTREIEQAGGRAMAITTDVTDRQQADQAVEHVISELGRLDILVNNAGIMLLGPVESAPLDEWERMLELNLKAVLYLTRAGLPHLLSAAETAERRVADVVTISSVAGRVARGAQAVYNSTKFGVGAFSEALRQELCERHVRVGLVEPGATDTELASHNRAEVREQIMSRFGDLDRLQADDIANAVTYMVTRERRVAVNELLIRPTQQAF